MRKTCFILAALITVVFIVVSCQKAKEPEGKKEVQVQQAQHEEVKQQPSKVEPQQKQPATESATKKLLLIWQKDFGKKIQRFKLHKSIGATDFPLMAVETEDALMIFDKKGKEKIKRQIPKLELEQKGKKETYRGYVVISDNGKYVLEGKGVPEFSHDLKYTTVEGKTLWKIKNFHGEPVVSPDGSVVVLLDTSDMSTKETKGGIVRKGGSINFYDRTGKLLKQHFMDISSIEMPLYRFAFSEDGNYFVLRVEQWIEDKTGRKASYPIILFDKKGNLFWQKNIEVTPGKTPPFELLISPHGRYIAYSSDKYICIVGNRGNLLWKKEFHNLLSFSEKEDILLTTNDYIAKDESFFVTNALTGEKLWSRNRGYPIISLDGSLLAIIESVIESDSEKLILHIVNMADKEEKLILKTKYIHPQKRKFQFSSDSKSLLYIEQKSETEILVYKLAFSTVD